MCCPGPPLERVSGAGSVRDQRDPRFCWPAARGSRSSKMGGAAWTRPSVRSGGSFPGEVERQANLLQGARVAGVEAVPSRLSPVPVFEDVEELVDLTAEHGLAHCVDASETQGRRLGLPVRCHRPATCESRLTGSVPAVAVRSHRARDIEDGGELGEGRCPSHLAFHLSLGAQELADLVAGVDWQADGAPRVSIPRLIACLITSGVGRELEALAPVELVDGVDEAEVSLLYQVSKGRSEAWYLLASDTTRRRFEL